MVRSNRKGGRRQRSRTKDGRRQRSKGQRSKDGVGGEKRKRITSFVDSLIESARGNPKRNIGIGVIPDAKAETLQNFVNEYENEGYAVMTQDKNKIDAYKLAIQTAVEKNHHYNWFEIGPGADAVLTHIVLQSSDKPPTHVFSLEGSKYSSDSAIKKLKMTKYEEGQRWILHHGLTTDEKIKSSYGDTIKAFATACVSELLGMIMSAEYVVDIMEDVQKNYVKEGTIMLPRWGATFYTPMLLEDSHLKQALDKLKSKGVGVGIDPNKNWLHATKVPIVKASVFPDESGALEFMDFAQPMGGQRYQQRTAYFKNNKFSNLEVNSLGLWIWFGFDLNPRRERLSKTGYPYGCKVDETEKYMVRGPVPIDCSSLLEEKERDVVCTNWRNVVMLFNENIVIPPDYSLKVESICDLRIPYQPKYIFHAFVCNSEGGVIDGPYISQMTTVYSEFQFDQVV